MQFNECDAGRYHPNSLLLQWHITERCNLRCQHCYQESYGGKELKFDKLLEIMEQYKELLTIWAVGSGESVPGHITITGGEPFVRRDFLDLLEVFAANKEYFTFAILTNGSYVDDTMACRLKRLGPTFIQISLDGMEATHDRIRGTGNFQCSVQAIKHLVKAGIRTLISFTAHRGNYHEFPDVARLGRRLGVARVWADRLLPSGSGSDIAEQMLSPTETREFFELMRQVRSEFHRFRWFHHTEVAMHRALQFLVSAGTPYQCTAGDSLITVQPNGDLYPCRRMPIRVSNLMETRLLDLYYQSELFLALRDRNRESQGCEGCFFTKLCRGGLKCLSYAQTGDPFTKDPGCWVPTHSETKTSTIRPSNVTLFT